MLVLLAVAAVAAAVALYLLLERSGASGLPLAILRALAWLLVAALLVDPGCRRSASPPPVVLLDGSRSMTDPGDSVASLARWRRAVDTARAIAGRSGRIIVFGAAPAPYRSGARPAAPTSRLLPAWREAVALGGPVTVVTDGEVDDAASLPADAAATARVVILARPERRDVGVAGLDLPASLRAGDTATATVTLAAAHTVPGDTATVELLEGSRVVARQKIAVGGGGGGGGGGGTFRRDLTFVPSPPQGDAEVRRYEVRVRGIRGDAEPRDDARATLAEVSRASAIAAFSDSPDWDFRALSASLAATSGVAVSAYVSVSDGAWRDAGTLKPAPAATVAEAARRAALVVVHGSPQDGALAGILRLARGSVWVWRAHGASTAGDWYVRPLAASPLGAALAGMPAESLPPLEGVVAAGSDSGAWTALEAQLSRRGKPRPVLVGSERAGRRTVRFEGSGLWRWASRGGVSAQAYAAVVAAAANWLLEPTARRSADLEARRDSMSAGLDELLPRAPTLLAEAGTRGAAAPGREREPLRHETWLYAAVVGALVVEWVARRRRGMR